MKNRYAWRWGLAVTLLAIGGISIGRAGEFAIQSFDGTGQLTFNEIDDAVAYRVEWAPAPDGPWTNFTGAAGVALDEIMARGSGIVTCSVPMCYRVIALVDPPSGMVWIPGGTNAGTNPLADGESYQGDMYPETYSLTMSSFCVDRYEVTKAQWDAVYTWAVSHGYSFDNAGSGKAADHPAHTVNWYDCVKWCNARSQKEGRPAVYMVSGAVYKTGQIDDVVQTSAAGYRLPTAAEWEYAARGGLSDQRFPWGANINHDYANYRANGSSFTYDTSSHTSNTYHPDYDDGGFPHTSPAGSFAANEHGLHDMSGNVWEWCFDWYPGFEDSNRVIRGGSWNNFANICRVGCRNRRWPYDDFDDIGFRAVLSPGQQ